jgi:hypothetical protein
MKGFFISFLCVSILTYTTGLLLPWWSVAISGFIPGLVLDQKRVFSFLSAFLGSFLVWATMSYIISINNDHILAGKISMIVLKNNSPLMLVMVTGLIGGLTSGFSALTGRSLAILFRN